MLPSSQRVPKGDFKEIFKKGRFWQSDNFSLVTLKDKETVSNKSRFAFSVSKGVSKKAVVRNKLRRRGYAVVQKLTSKIKPSFWAVFILKKESSRLSFKEFEEEIVFLLQKSKLLEEN